MPTLDELLSQAPAAQPSAEVRADVPQLVNVEKQAAIRKMLRAMHAPEDCVKLNTWLLRHVGTSQIIRGIADAT